MRILALFAAACTLTAADNAREIVRKSVQLMDQNLVTARNYTFLERTETREFDGGGRVKSHKIELFDVTLLEGSPYRRLVGKDDHPLSPEEQRNEEKKLQESIAQRQKETPEQRARRIAEWEKRRQREREPLAEIPDAFDFRITGEEVLEGRPAWVLEATPHPGYHARSALAQYFPKFRGRLWVDKGDNQWVKTEAEAMDNLWWGLFLARLNKGARLNIQMTRVNDEVWLPRRVDAQGSGRLALFKRLSLASQTTFSEYRKFQAESRIVAVTPP